MKTNRKKSMGQRKYVKAGSSNITDLFRFGLLTNYVCHSRVIHVAFCIILEAKSDWTLMETIRSAVIDLNELGQDK